jgi:hypothetical protein
MRDISDAVAATERRKTMPTTITNVQQEIAAAVRQELLRLARIEDTRAADEAATVPYWAPCPTSVVGHRAAAQALRREADRIAA